MDSKDKGNSKTTPTFREVFHPSKDRWDFIGHTRTWGILSTVLVVATFLLLPVNWKVRGAPLNWGIDFRGGTEMRVEFAKEVAAGDLRQAVEAGGYHGSDVVAFGTAARRAYLIRLPQVSTLQPEKAEALKKSLQKVGDATLVRFGYTEGGDKLDLKFDKDVPEDAVSAAIKSAGVETTLVRRFGRVEDHAFEITLSGIEKGVTDAIKAKLGGDAIAQVASVETVGAKAGKQLRDDGVKSLLYAIMLIMIYIAVRFDFRYGPGTVIALLHDAIMTVLAFAITYREFSLTTLAAILTIIGYSMNDTIIVFDRIRENAAKSRDKKFETIVNESINETMARTVLTSLTTFASAAFMWALGRGVIADFGFALMVGIVVGTYSSIFIASPALIWLHNRMQAGARSKTGAQPRDGQKGKRVPEGAGARP